MYLFTQLKYSVHACLAIILPIQYELILSYYARIFFFFLSARLLFSDFVGTAIEAKYHNPWTVKINIRSHLILVTKYLQ